MIMVFLTAACIKDTYDMDMVSKKMHLTPSFNIAAVKGDISLSDMVTPNDTLIFDQNNLVKIVLTQDSIFDLTISDFLAYNKKTTSEGGKGFGQLMASFEPDSINLEIEDILSRITGDIHISNPSIMLYYSNSFSFPVRMKLDAIGKRQDKTPVSLDLDTFALSFTNEPEQPKITDLLLIDRSNSSIAELISLPPEEIKFSGTVMMDTLGIKDRKDSYLSSLGHILGRLEIEVPIEFRINNLQFSDTLDNFLSDDGESDDSPIKPEDFELIRADITANNGFPVGVSVSMSLYDSLSQTILSTVEAMDLLGPAPVDINGKASGVTETKTTIEFTEDFFNSIDQADNIIFKFTLNTTDNGSTDVKIYSDYRIDFSASLAVKADINLD